MKRHNTAAPIPARATTLATAPHAPTNNGRVLRLPEVCLRLGVSRSTIYAQQNLGVFPPSIHLGARAVGWLEHEVEAVLAARAAGALEEQVRVLVSSLVAARQGRSSANWVEVWPTNTR